MKCVRGVGLSVVICGAPQLGLAQPALVVLSGVVNGPNGSPVSGAKVTAKNTATSETAETQSDSSGHYSFPNLPPGAYEVAATAEGFSARQLSGSIATGAAQTGDIALGAASSAPALGDLGFPTPQTRGGAADQALLDRRSHMLQMHQRLGWITAAPLVATLIRSGGAGGRSASSASRDLHAALGSLTVGMYVWTASYAIRAPKIQGTPTRGPIGMQKGAGLGPRRRNGPDAGARHHGVRSEKQGRARPRPCLGARRCGLDHWGRVWLAIASVSFKF